MIARNDMEAVEISIEKAKASVKMLKALERLQKNRDFKYLIDECYLEKEALRLVYLKSDFSMSDPAQQDFIDRGIEAIGQFRNFLSMVYRQGDMAAQALADHEKTREDMLSEELEGDE
jgi:hypothetical protein